MTTNEQPWVTSWPMRAEDLSKIPVGLDMAAARERLARKFNSRPVRLGKEAEIERSWGQYAVQSRRAQRR